MTLLNKLVAAVLMSVALLAAPVAMAGDTDPLFVNATTDDEHRAKMALMFAANQQQRKHPVTIFLNDKAVVIATKKKAKKFAEHQKLIADIVKGGGNILICPNCLKHYKIAESDLIEGVKVGNPELTGSLLFKDNTKTLTW